MVTKIGRLKRDDYQYFIKYLKNRLNHADSVLFM